MTRVLSIIHYPIFGGPHNRNARVAPRLSRQGIETTVVLPDEPGNAAGRLTDAGVNVVTIPLTRIRAKYSPAYHLRLMNQFSADVRRLRQVIREEQIDVVQINGLVNAQGAVAARRERVPVVWQILDTYAPMALRRLIMPIVRRLADAVMCTGEKVAAEHPGLLSMKDRVVYFFPPVDLERFRRMDGRRDEARDQLGIGNAHHVIGNVGNVNLQKGHGTFIRAAARLREKFPATKFVILGAIHKNHEEYAARLWREAESLGLRMERDLIVRDPGSDVAALSSAFDVFWMTSEPRSEGIPTAMEEAMALGMPVVATEVGSVSEIVWEGETGFVVPSRDVDALAARTAEILQSNERLGGMGRAARAKAEQYFAVDECAKTHLRAYEIALRHNERRA